MGMLKYWYPSVSNLNKARLFEDIEGCLVTPQGRKLGKSIDF